MVLWFGTQAKHNSSYIWNIGILFVYLGPMLQEKKGKIGEGKKREGEGREENKSQTLTNHNYLGFCNSKENCKFGFKSRK